MQVDLDFPQSFRESTEKNIKNVWSHKKCKNIKMQLNITRSIFELEARNFAWKFVWIVRTNYKHTKKYISTKVLITQPFFELQTSDFAWKFIWTIEPNDKVQKVQKYKKVHKYKSTHNSAIF